MCARALLRRGWRGWRQARRRPSWCSLCEEGRCSHWSFCWQFWIWRSNIILYIVYYTSWYHVFLSRLNLFSILIFWNKRWKKKKLWRHKICSEEPWLALAPDKHGGEDQHYCEIDRNLETVLFQYHNFQLHNGIFANHELWIRKKQPGPQRRMVWSTL